MIKLLVLGVGNILLRDEGVGSLAAQELAKESWPDNVTFMDGGIWSQDMFHLFKDYSRMLILDVAASNKSPGAIFRIRERDLSAAERRGFSLHEINLLDSLALADLLGGRPELTILGIEPDSIEWGEGLSPALQAAYPAFLDEARRLIAELLQE